MQPIISLHDVSLTLTGRQILQDVSMEIEQGSISVILGPSGVGKSTILKIILGLLKVDSGKVVISGKDMTSSSEEDDLTIRRKIGMVFQGNALFDSLTVAENAAYFLLENEETESEKIDRKVKEVLSFVNLSGTEDLYPEQLSGGMKKRLAIARALTVNPDIILFDEPTTGLDPINSKAVLQLIQNLKSIGTTSVIVTHIVNDALAIGDKLIVLHEGTIVAAGGIKDVMHLDNPFIKEFLYEIFESPAGIGQERKNKL